MKTNLRKSDYYYFREDLQLRPRNYWVANVARLFKFLDVAFEFEHYSFTLTDSNPYRPSFYIVDSDHFVEVIQPDQSRLFAQAQLLYELYDYRTDIIDSLAYKNLHNKFSKIIPNWETTPVLK